MSQDQPQVKLVLDSGEVKMEEPRSGLDNGVLEPSIKGSIINARICTSNNKEGPV